MKGKILDYNFQDSKGVISGDDGDRYYFENSEWKGSVNPKIGQVVDFELDGQNAKGIYLVKTSVSFDGVADKLGDLNAQEKVDVVKDKLSTIKKNGIQNKFGFIVSVILAIFMFIPITNGVMGTGYIKLSVLDSDFGYFTLIITLISSFLFYSGGKHIFTKISTIVASASILLFLREIYSLASATTLMFGSRNKGTFDFLIEMLNFSALILIVLTILYVISGFKKGYKEIGVNNEG